ncbi:hypothetical protein [Streptomyces massasporeus]|uniref:hypothetical protein n=1 Tax=Streptomyces massasporeus TaxID=67324 RepID=UPI0036F860E8
MHTTIHLLPDAPPQMLPTRSLMAFTLASHIVVLPAFPAIALLYWPDTHGELESLTGADLRRRGAGGHG